MSQAKLLGFFRWTFELSDLADASISSILRGERRFALVY